VHQRLINHLENHADLDRGLEFLPSDAEIGGRLANGKGLSSPELAVVVAYTKLDLKAKVLASTVPDDPWFEGTLAQYFPTRIQQEYSDGLDKHPLRREIITNAVVNNMVNRAGTTFAFRAAEETGADPAQITRAYVITREIFGLADYLATVESLDNRVTTDAQTTLYLELRRLLDRATRWFLSTRSGELDVAAEIALFQEPIAQYAALVPQVLQGSERRRLERRAKELVEGGTPEALAMRAAALLDVFSLLDIVRIAHDTDTPIEDTLRVYYHASERFGIDDMLFRVSQLPREDRWDALARGALRDDLYAVLDGITRGVLATSNPRNDARTRFGEWTTANAEALDRARSGLRAILRLENPNIAALSVALRTLRAFVRSSATE